MPPKHRGPSTKGKNKLFRHEVHNIRLGVGYTVIGKHTIRLLVDRLTAEEERKIADHTQANAESVMHMEVCDLALSYGNREFLVLKRQLEPLCLTTRIALHYHQRIAKTLLQAFAEHIECDSYFALMNLTMAFARDIGKLFIPYFDLFSQALMRGLYDKGTGSMFIAKTDRVQLTFTALSALVIGIGGIVSNALTPGGSANGGEEDDEAVTATYDRSFVPTLPPASEMSEEQRGLVASIRRVIALVVQRTFRDTKEYIRRLGAEVIAALCRRHARLLPIALGVCTQSVGMEVRAARLAAAKNGGAGKKKAKAKEDAEKDASDASGSDGDDADAASDDDDDDDDAASVDSSAEEHSEEALAAARRPILPEDLTTSAVADSVLYLTQNLLIGIKGALTTHFEGTFAAIVSGLINQSVAADADSAADAALAPQSLHSIASHVVCGTFSSVIASVKADPTRTAIPRVLSALVDELLPPAARALEAELFAAPAYSSDSMAVSQQRHSALSTSADNASSSVAIGNAARFLRAALAAISAAGQAVVNHSIDNPATATALKGLTDGVLALLKSARGHVKPKTALPPNLPLLLADALSLAQSLLITDRYASPAAIKAGEAFVAAILAEAGRMLQGAMGTSDRTLLLTVVHTLKDFTQDVSQKAAAHAARYGHRTDAEGGLTMPCFDEFVVAVFIVITAKAAHGQLEASLRRDLIDSLMVMAEVAQSTLVSASAAAGSSTLHAFPNLLAKAAAARVPTPPILTAAPAAAEGKKGSKAQQQQQAQPQPPKPLASLFTAWLREDVAEMTSLLAEDAYAPSEEAHILRHLERVSVWLSLVNAIGGTAATSAFEPCVAAMGALLAAAGKKDSKLFLSAKLRTRLLQTYVRGSAALSEGSSADKTKGSEREASKLSALIHQIAAAIPAGFHPAAEAGSAQRHPNKPAAEADAGAHHTTVSLLLTAFERLRSSFIASTSSSAAGEDDAASSSAVDTSAWIPRCIAPEAYNDFVFVLMHSLATTTTPSTRLSTLVLLRDCYAHQHRLAMASAAADKASALPPFAIVSALLSPARRAPEAAAAGCAADLAVFDTLIRCEKIDPLSEGLDAKANVLAPIVFDAASTTNYFDRYGGRSDAFMVQLLVRFCFGAVNVKFAPMWTIAIRIIGSLLRHELLRKGTAAGSSADGSSTSASSLGLWERLAQPLIVAATLGNRDSSTHSSASASSSGHAEDDTAPIAAALTAGLYALSFDDSQLHASGALVSRAFRQISADSVRARTVHQLPSGARLTMADVAFGCAASASEASPTSQSTDPASVTRVLLNTLMTLSDHLHHGRPASSAAVLSLPEQLVLRLAESDVGATFGREDEASLGLSAVPTTNNSRALNQRLEMAILAMAAQFTLNTNAMTAGGRVSAELLSRRRAALEAALLQYVCSTDSRLQAAAVEGLRKMGVAPYAQYSDHLFPICGGRLSVADFTTSKNKSGNNKKGGAGAVDGAPKRLGTSNAKSALTFLQSFTLETAVKEEHRVQYITALLLLCLPVLTATGRAGSGGNAHKKVRDREVLGRKVFALLSRVKSDETADPLALVVDVLMERILQLPSEASAIAAGADPMTRYDLVGQLVGGSDTAMTVPKLRRRYEQLSKRLVSAVKLLQALVPAVGTRFLEYSQRCFILLLRTYEASMPSSVVARAGLDTATVRLPGESGNGIRRHVIGLIRNLLDTYPSAIAEFVVGNAGRTQLFLGTLDAIYSHAPIAASAGTGVQVGIRGGTTAPLPPPIEVALTLSHHAELHPLLLACAEGFVLPAVERYFRQTASDAVVLAVLDIVGRVVGHADERLTAVHIPTSAGDASSSHAQLTATTLRKGLLEPHGEAIFTALHRFVTATSDAVLSEVPTAKKDRPSGAVNPLRVSPRIWKDVILLASALPEYIRGGNAGAEALERNMAQLLEIAINFARSPVCASDRASADMAAETIESIIRQVPTIHPTNHFRRLIHLFNNVTAPVARTVLCGALKVAVTKIEGMTDLATMLQLQAVARCVACMNAFSRSDTDADAAPTGAKRGRKDEAEDEDKDKASDDEAAAAVDELDATDFSRYDFELRYHAFFALTTFFNKASGERGAPTTAVGKTNKALATSRTERRFVGEQDCEIPLTIEQPRLTMEAGALLALNFLFFIRDRERTIRTFAGESLHGLVKYVSQYPIFTGVEEASPADSLTSVAAAADPLNQLIRPVLLPALRRGIVSKDSSSRLEHMQGFGYLAQHLPTHFPSLAILYSPNSEANFYSCVASAQHRVRMNALNFLRKKCGQMHQREVLRVFVPFIVTYLKDYAQGKQDARTEQVSEAKQKGFADSLLMTLAAISAHMPWEGYQRILSLLLKEAKDHEALRAVMLKGIVRVLESFHFLETDASTGERRITSDVAEWSDDEAAAEGNAAAAAPIDPATDENNAAAELATSALAPSARAERKNVRIMAILEEEVLPQLYAFILTQKKAHKAKDLEGTLHEGSKGIKNQERKSEPKASVQLPVAVGILKIIRLFPQHRFDHHVDLLLNEVVLKLRTKNDKQRETARSVLFAMMNEAGPQKLRFVVTKLRDNLVHGYQLHVLGYTLVGLLQSMFGFAGERATVAPTQPLTEEEEAAEAEAEAEAAAADGEDSDDEEGAEKKKGAEGEAEGDDANADENLATTDGKKAPSAKKAAPKPVMPHTPADEKRIIGRAFRMGGTRRRIFSTAESTAALDAVMSDLFDVFIDDYLGEVGDQKEQTELISTLREVKHNKSLQGFSFLAMHCSGDSVMDMFVTKIRWVLAPPTAKELLKNTANSANVMGDNTKYMHGGKRRAADARFVERVRVLAVRVAKALVLNETLSLGAALTSSLTMLNRNNALRESKIAEFEAKDGTRRIRGNIDQFTAAKRLTLQEQRDKNYVVEERPDRIDFDFSSHTVLATQHKQKLKVYKGAYAKHLKETSKGFRNEDNESAVVLDTLDEFNLKFLLLLLKKALGIGRATASARRGTKIVTEAPAEGEEGAAEEAADANADADENANEEAEEDADAVDETSPLEEGYDEMELFERQQRREDELGEGRAVQRNAAKAAKKAKADKSLAELFGAEHKGQLTELLVPVLAVLQGEGADSVVITGFEVTHALLAINPPLPAVQTSGQVLFDVIADLFERGGEVKPRAMRVLSALVQHSYFTIANEQAVWITKVARGEIIERTKHVAMGLGLLQAVVNRRVEVIEVYELIDSVTELLVHKAASPPVRNRCVSIIAKFVTEYRLTMQKLQSHINMYVQNLQYPNVDGRLAMLELLGVLVFRLPQQVLRDEANVLFVPLVHCMAESPWPSCQEKAAVVIQSLVLNAGVDLVAKTIGVWLQSETMRTREYAMQVLAVILPIVPQLYGADATEEAVAHDEAARAERFEVVKAATEWAISELQQALVYDHPLSKSKQQQIRDDIQKEVAAKIAAAKGSAKKSSAAMQDVALMVSRRLRAEKEMASWSFTFFALRAVEALTVISPSFAEYFAGGENAPIFDHLAKSLVPHSHPWVRSAATRVFANYLKGYLFAAMPYGDLSVRWTLGTAEAGEATEDCAFLALPTSYHNGVVTVNASAERVAEVQEAAKRIAKHLLVVVSTSDVRDELHYGYRAIDDPLRSVIVDAIARLARLIAVTATLLGDGSALKSLWAQLQSMIEPVLAGRGVRGYLVRSASMVQLLGQLIRDLPYTTINAAAGTAPVPNLVAGIVDVPLLESFLVPFVGICAESTEVSHRVAEFGLATVEAMKIAVAAHGPEFEGLTAAALAASEAARGDLVKRNKKRKAEAATGGSILAVAAAEAANSRTAHAAVALALTKITDELKEKQRLKKVAEMHEKNFKKAQRQEENAAKMEAMNRKRTGGKRRSRYA